jgi:hypothetical protein
MEGKRKLDVIVEGAIGFISPRVVIVNVFIVLTLSCNTALA